MASSRPPKYYQFHVGEVVDWDRIIVAATIKRMDFNFRKRIGDGPFIVKTVSPVPTGCTCGLKRSDEEGKHKEDCDESAVRRTGHNQILHVARYDLKKKAEGEKIDGGISGILLQPVETGP